MTKKESTTRALPEKWRAEEPSRLEGLFYGDDTPVIAPADESELREALALAKDRRLRLVPAGLGTRPYLGNPPSGDLVVVSLRRFARIARYEPEDYTVGVEAGVPLVALRDALGANGQEIPIDVLVGSGGTIGGLVAAQQPGLRHGRFGPVRSWIIGLHALDGRGRRFKAGGMVVKNVAGYEVARFLPGTLGAAGFLLEINFKLRPLPALRRARVAWFSGRAAACRFAQALRGLRLQPSSLLALSPAPEPLPPPGAHGGGDDRGGGDGRGGGANGGGVKPREDRHAVFWLFEDVPENVAWQEARVETLTRESRPDEISGPIEGEGLTATLECLGAFDRPAESFLEETGIARLAVLPSAVSDLAEEIGKMGGEAGGAPLSLMADVPSGLITVRWCASGDRLAAPLARLGELAAKHGGRGALVYLPPGARRTRRSTFVREANEEIRRKLLKVFDPAGVFCSDRL